MKPKLFALTVGLLLSLCALSATGKPSLIDKISDPKHLQEALGPKAYIITDAYSGKASAELSQAIRHAKLDKSVQFFPLPPESRPAEPKKRVPPHYPTDLRRSHVSGLARFLFLIEADGTVKHLYCFDATHRDFAEAGAEALLKWRFTPAQIENTPVPLLASQTLEFNTN